jgi:hypothetical protein
MLAALATEIGAPLGGSRGRVWPRIAIRAASTPALVSWQRGADHCKQPGPGAGRHRVYFAPLDRADAH